MVLAGEIVRTSDFETPYTTRCRAYSSAGVAATVNNTLTLVPFASESYDSVPAMHDTGVNPSRITVPVSGSYHIIAQCGWAANTVGRRVVAVRKNAAGAAAGGTQIMIVSQAPTPGSGAQIQVTDEIVLAAGEYVEMFALQQSTVALDVTSGETNTFMVVRLVDPT